MTVTSPAPNVGGLLRTWRQRRRMSQLELAVEAEVSTKHLSFVETGRARPSRELVLHLAEHLEVPLRDRNSLLMAAGYAPIYQERSLDADDMAPVRLAIDQFLASNEPFPTVAVDRCWDLIALNQPAATILTDGVAPSLLEPPANALRIALHPDGLAPRIANLAEYANHLLNRLQRQAVLSADRRLVELLDELRDYPGVPVERTPEEPAAALFVPMVLRSGGTELTFFSTMTTFGTALDITLAELSVESFFPADDATAAALSRSR